MSKRPTGTSMDEDRLLELRAGHEAEGGESAYVVDVTPLVDRMALPADALVDWTGDEREGVPALVCGPIDEDEVSTAAYPRRLYENERSVFVPVPDGLLEAPPDDGIGLDLEAYDGDNPLLFEAIATEETIALVPARYGDGTPYTQEPLPETPDKSDPVAAETIAHEPEHEGDPTPRPETVDAPIDADIIEQAGEVVTLEDLASALETVSRRDLADDAEGVPDRPPLSVDDRAVHPLEADAWETTIGPALEAEGDVLEAAKAVHERQAERLIDRADAQEYRLEGDHEVVVTHERDTAEWEEYEP